MKTLFDRFGTALTLVVSATALPAAENNTAEDPAPTEVSQENLSPYGWAAHPEGLADPSPPTVRLHENEVVFSSHLAAPQSMPQMREQLDDPEQRARLRVELREMVAKQYPDLAEELGIDPQTERKLLDLLADEQLTQREAFAESDFDRGVQLRAEAETKRLAALREMLGNDGLEKYRGYISTSLERAQVRRLDAMLAPGDKLQPEQRQQLIELLAERSERERQASSPRGWNIEPFVTLPSQEEMRRQSQLATIAANEDALRRMEKLDPPLEQQAAQFLSPTQLAAFTRENRQNAASLRSWIQNAREQAGLNPAIPQEPDRTLVPPAPIRTPVAGPVMFELEVSVDGGEQRTFTHTGENSHPFQVRASEDLWIEVTSTLFDNHWLDVQLAYLERTSTGKRRLESETSFGALLKLPDGRSGGGGLATDVVSGSKGYAVRALVKARQAQ